MKLEKKLGLLIPIFKDKKTGKLYGDSFAEVFDCVETNLVYDGNTKVVYYSEGFGPYLSENGKYCRFNDDEEIVEIE